MRLYVVGGAVRDRLLGEPATDRDWVAVGATPEQLLALGYKPVGRDFPVFLHPRTGEEVALARTERKSGRGYHGFTFHAAPEVTLEQDLARRDLTINAMAEDEHGRLIDPFGGARDLDARVLRHVSPAFAEDPVRLLRVARFAARWPGFTVAPETMALLARMVHDGEVDALVAERVWQELARGLMAPRPGRMLEVLAECGALPRLLPEAHADAAARRALDVAAAAGAPLPVRHACLGWPDEAAARHAAARLRAPHDCAELAALLARERDAIDAAATADAAGCVALFDRCDAWRRPARFADLLQAHACASRGAGDGFAADLASRRLPPLLRAAAAVDTAAVAGAAAARGATGPAIGAAVRAAREHAVRAALAAPSPPGGT